MEQPQQQPAETAGNEQAANGNAPAPDQQLQMMAMMQQQMEQMRFAQESMMRTMLENQELKEKLKQATNNPAPQTKKPDRPSINIDCTDSDWSIFIDSWSRYKAMSRLTSDGDIRHELRATCSAEVNAMMFNLIGPDVLNGANEATLLQHIKQVAVQPTHVEVHRQKFFRMTQADGETVNQFVGKLKAQASLCTFNVTCTCHVESNYAEEMVAHQMISGLGNTEHQGHMLAEAPNLKTFKSKMDKLIALETSSIAAPSKLTQLTHAKSVSAAQKSAYNRQKLQENVNRRSQTTTPSYKKQEATNRTPQWSQYKPPPGQVCRGCGKKTHPDGKSMSRGDCPSFGHKCGFCQTLNHLESACKQKSKSAGAYSEDANHTSTNYYPADQEYQDACTFNLAVHSDFRDRHPPHGRK